MFTWLTTNNLIQKLCLFLQILLSNCYVIKQINIKKKLGIKLEFFKTKMWLQWQEIVKENVMRIFSGCDVASTSRI